MYTKLLTSQNKIKFVLPQGATINPPSGIENDFTPHKSILLHQKMGNGLLSIL